MLNLVLKVAAARCDGDRPINKMGISSKCTATSVQGAYTPASATAAAATAPKLHAGQNAQGCSQTHTQLLLLLLRRLPPCTNLQ